MRVGGARIPLDATGRCASTSPGRPAASPCCPFRGCWRPPAGRPLPELEGAVVLIGLTARSQQDAAHATPYANHYARYLSVQTPGLMSGTEIHAHILATLWDGAYVTTPWWLSPLPLLLVCGGTLGMLFARLSLGAGLVVAVVHHFAWKGMALAAFAVGSWPVKVVAMLLLGFFTYATAFTHSAGGSGACSGWSVGVRGPGPGGRPAQAEPRAASSGK